MGKAFQKYCKNCKGERMKNIKYILFDCMETIVDLRQLPDLRDYAFWGYNGSGVEDLWEDFDEFFRYYLLARSEVSARLHEYQDYDMFERFLLITRLSFPDFPVSRIEYTAKQLNLNYWQNYKATCYAREDVLAVLPLLAEKYRLGVVSNFMVTGGIEELLEINGVLKYFDVVVTSVREGWRKPHPVVYEAALERLGAKAEETVFIGDDYVNDFVTPTKLGMTPLFLDRYGKHPEVSNKVSDFYGLSGCLLITLRPRNP
ncbi:MAG: HAD family hydrolase [Ruminiclostridium sp.]|nr:HAD family hydrolase [Ruminiclostridium sp.]